ncbi:MAG: signal peptidase I [Oscillospiraceae bacterium]|jgi:signal peptidase|nr:signal peptidase I [Oscillospiraceae bacterium]
MMDFLPQTFDSLSLDDIMFSCQTNVNEPAFVPASVDEMFTFVPDIDDLEIEFTLSAQTLFPPKSEPFLPSDEVLFPGEELFLVPTAFTEAPAVPQKREQWRNAQSYTQQNTAFSPLELEEFGMEKAAGPAQNRMPTGLKKLLPTILNLVFYSLCILLVASAAMFALSKDVQKSYLGYRLYNVLTPSMTPRPNGPSGGFREGDMIVVQLCDASEIQVGDVITFVPGRDSRAYLTHRVYEIKNELDGVPGIYFVTHGDANFNADGSPALDPPIRGDGENPMLIGKKVFTIPKAGAFLQGIRENPKPCIIAIFAVLGFFLALQWYLKGTPQAIKKARRRAFACA